LLYWHINNIIVKINIVMHHVRWTLVHLSLLIDLYTKYESLAVNDHINRKYTFSRVKCGYVLTT
jgi:hypothetical protein